MSARERLGYRKYRALRFRCAADLVSTHFSMWADGNHVNIQGFQAALRLTNDQPQLIVETGTSAWGTDSTRLWDAYVNNFGGEFWSVDISPEPSQRLQNQVGSRTHLIVEDSVTFLERIAAERGGDRIGIAYLDSWDLDWDDPEPAERHGLLEWHAIKGLFGPGSILIIDDSPGSLDWVPSPLQERGKHFLSSRGFLPGKGALVEKELRGDARFTKIWHGYNLVYLCTGGAR